MIVVIVLWVLKAVDKIALILLLLLLLLLHEIVVIIYIRGCELVYKVKFIACHIRRC